MPPECTPSQLMLWGSVKSCCVRKPLWQTLVELVQTASGWKGLSRLLPFVSTGLFFRKPSTKFGLGTLTSQTSSNTTCCPPTLLPPSGRPLDHQVLKTHDRRQNKACKTSSAQECQPQPRMNSKQRTLANQTCCKCQPHGTSIPQPPPGGQALKAQ